MRGVIEGISRSRGWRRRLLAVSAGAFGALALAPLDLTPALVVTLSVAVWLLDSCAWGEPGSPRAATLRTAFATGWWLGLGYFVAGLWWLGSAFIIEPEFLWALPLGIVGLPALLALFTGAGFMAARCLWSPGPARVLALAIGLGAAEWARGHLFTGFPWNSFGMGLGEHLLTAQTASLIGLDGLNILTVALFAAPATLADKGPHRWRPTIVAGLTFGAILGFGAYRLAGDHADVDRGIVVRIMQPGIKPDEKFSYENRDEIVARYIALSQQVDPVKGTRLEDVDLLVWPESAFPFILQRDPQALSSIGAMLPAKTTLVTGAAREQASASNDASSSNSAYFNDIMVINHDSQIIDTYDKMHLVPFGEYLPFDKFLRAMGLRNFVSIPGGFEPGTRRDVLRLPGLPAAIPLICYEAIFPGEVGADPGPQAPRFILNVTNDGWFGRTPGPAQHFAQARLRTIEEGLPMVRGAGTGISAIIDAYGRIDESLPLGDAGVLDGHLPRARSKTFFATHPTVALIVVCIATSLIWFLLRRNDCRSEVPAVKIAKRKETPYG